MKPWKEGRGNKTDERDGKEKRQIRTCNPLTSLLCLDRTKQTGGKQKTTKRQSPAHLRTSTSHCTPEPSLSSLSPKNLYLTLFQPLHRTAPRNLLSLPTHLRTSTSSSSKLSLTPHHRTSLSLTSLRTLPFFLSEPLHLLLLRTVPF